MFYGLNRFLKKILPKQLFYRSLLIVAAPIIIMQLTISIVFFDSLWIKTNKGMTRALVNEIATFVDAYKNENNDKEKIILLFKKHLQFNIKYESNKKFPESYTERWFSPIDRSLRRELKSQNFNYWFDTVSYKNLINLKIKYNNGYFQFFVPRERLTSASVRLFALWITLPAILVIFIAILFLKNQTRPITKLAEASERFGRGEDIEEYRPSGALEIRKAGLEFDRMRKRILRHLNQRSEMLSGISHDLRTPLTRIKLQLAFIKDKDTTKKISSDVDEMEKMLNGYLQFSRSNFTEKNEKFNLSQLINDIVQKYEKKNILFEKDSDIFFNGRKNLIKRCLNNLLDNAISFSKNIKLTQQRIKRNVLIFLEDDGPGISPSEYENVFKPFYKIDKSRNQTKSSVGLGLSIASDIIRSHGGNIELGRSEMGGLKIKIILPV
jgi:two-component system osmolarity sensor histidine kinase EnvZ|tara:strand:- start:353 stop:1666 length:1314 start_codon:yes stop_codon:yes gene_type:complete